MNERGEKMANILIVEDEEAINELVKRNLSLVGHSCLSAMDGEEALQRIQESKIDLIILDIMLPKLDGFEVMKQIKGIPTIFLIFKSSVDDRVKGLMMGADDYMTKPFEMLELIARVEAVLRRTKKDEDIFEIDDVKVNLRSRIVWVKNQQMDCTIKEFELLEALIRNRNVALSREKLLEIVWGFDYEGETRTVDVHIQKIRKKFHLEKRIATVYKLGYRLEVQDEE